MQGEKSQTQTQKTFSYKWHDKKYTYESETVKSKVYQWLLERYFEDEAGKGAFLEQNAGKTFLDAGCGNGHSASVIFGPDLEKIRYTGIDISEDAITEAEKRFRNLSLPGSFKVANIQKMKLGRKYDIIFSEGVIHHTSDPYETLSNLDSHLIPGGRLMFYVYRKKAPVREFVDDFIREQISDISNEEAWKKLLPLTKLGIQLGELKAEIELTENLELLGIPKGKYNLQRFFYWFFFKAYYDPDYTIDEMNHINFDWYMPQNCYRFEPWQIIEWLNTHRYEKERFRIEEAGITVIAKKESTWPLSETS